MIAGWCWDLVEPYLRRNLLNRGVERPSRKDVLAEFGRVWPEFTATIGVQEPWAGTIRFKWLVRLESTEMTPFLDDPAGWIAERFGGGKFKMNLHHGMHFVNTKNFKPEGAPRWQDAPEIAVD
ncbi:MAG TPA: hypothetical protein VEA38_11535 [Terriglobales bacterium]|nr:hypothetical protein [Terriglobales bacterium]